MANLLILLRQVVSIIRYPRIFLFAKRMGKNNRLGPGGKFLHHKEIYLGDNIYIAPRFHISARNLKIGNGVLIGPNLLLECDDHIFKTVGKTIWSMRHEKNIGFVTIEDDVWIGGNVTILKNTVVGEGCIVGASSLINKPLPPYTICLGTPCRSVKTRFTREELQKHLEGVKSRYTSDEIFEIWDKHGLA
jgi:acetyltransferase-like isoleucine patch superfamily enzyme